MGLFDDLLPGAGGGKAPAAPAIGGGLFDDLIPQRPATPSPGLLSTFGQSFTSTLGSQPGMFADALEAIRLQSGIPTEGIEKTLRTWSLAEDKQFKPPVESLGTALSGQKPFGDAMSWLAANAGSGLATTVAPVISGGLGLAAGTAAAGPAGAIPGAVLGALGSAYPMNMADIYGQLKQEGIDPGTASKAAMAVAVPVSALDVYGLGKITGIAAKSVKKDAIRILATRIKEGAIGESWTEAMQQAIQEAAAGYLTGQPKVPERLERIGEAGIIGGTVGGIGGGITAPLSMAKAKQAPEEEAKPAEPVVPEAPEKPADVPVLKRVIVSVGGVDEEGDLLRITKDQAGNDVAFVRTDEHPVAFPIPAAQVRDAPITEAPPAAPVLETPPQPVVPPAAAVVEPATAPPVAPALVQAPVPPTVAPTPVQAAPVRPPRPDLLPRVEQHIATLAPGTEVTLDTIAKAAGLRPDGIRQLAGLRKQLADKKAIDKQGQKFVVSAPVEAISAPGQPPQAVAAVSPLLVRSRRKPSRCPAAHSLPVLAHRDRLGPRPSKTSAPPSPRTNLDHPTLPATVAASWTPLRLRGQRGPHLRPSSARPPSIRRSV